MSTVRYLMGCLCFVLGSTNAQAQPPKDLCLPLFQRKAFLSAAKCYESKIPNTITSATLSEAKRVAYGRLLRNAALAYKAAGRSTLKTEQAHYWYERALLHINRYLTLKLYENPYRKQSAVRLVQTLQTQIPYSTLTIVGRANEVFEIKGFSFVKQFRSVWSQKVRPGRYRLTQQASKTNKQRTFFLRIEPNKVIRFVVPQSVPKRRVPVRPRVRVLVRPKPPLVRTQSPPQVQTKMTSPTGRRVGWALLGAGGGGVLLGGGLLGGGLYAEQQRQDSYQEAQRTNDTSLAATRRIFQHHETAKALYPSGYAVLGVSGGLVLTGILLVALNPRRAVPQTSLPNKTSKSPLSLWTLLP